MSCEGEAEVDNEVLDINEDMINLFKREEEFEYDDRIMS